jgi:predicted dehydrogenase
MTTASVVLVGYGLGGRVFHAPLIAAEPGLSLDAIVTSRPDRSVDAQAAHPGVSIYGSLDEALDRGHRLAVISTANITHVPFAERCLRAGLDVVLDKPIAPTADAARKLADLAEEQGRLLIPFQNRRWDSDFQTVQEVARAGRLGLLHRFESRIERMRIAPKPGWKISDDPAEMGGMLYDLGAHAVDQALALMGPVVSVAATVRSVRPTDPTDDDVVLLLTHDSGAVSLVIVSQVGAFGEPRMTLLGTHGGLRIDASDSQEAAIKDGGNPAAAGWGREPAGTEALLRLLNDDNVATDTRVPLVPGAWPQFYRGVAAALQGEGDPPVRIADVIEDLRVLDAARLAGSSGTTVALDPPAGHSPR